MKYKRDQKKLGNGEVKITARVFHVLTFVLLSIKVNLTLKSRPSTRGIANSWVIKSEGRSVFTAAASFNLDEPSY